MLITGYTYQYYAYDRSCTYTIIKPPALDASKQCHKGALGHINLKGV